MRNISKERFVATDVLVKFEDGSASFCIPEGATLTDISENLDKVGTWHSKLLSIDVRFKAPNDSGFGRGAKQMPDQIQTCLSEAILAEIPHLRAYAGLMTNDVSSADREVTEALQRALSNIERLRKRQGLRVQLLKILRNILVIGEAAPGKFRPLPAICERLRMPFRNVVDGHRERPDSLVSALLLLNFENREAVVLRAGVRVSREDAAKIIGCELHVYDARVRSGFARLAELLPRQMPTTSAGEATASSFGDANACRAFSGINKALELQERLSALTEGEIWLAD